MQYDINYLCFYFKFEDLEFQKKAQSIIGHADRRDLLHKKISELEHQNGPQLTQFLSECHCVENFQQVDNILKTPLEKQAFDTDGCKNLEDYDSKIVVYKNVMLVDNIDEPILEVHARKRAGRKKKGSTSTTSTTTSKPTTTMGLQLKFSHLGKIRSLYVQEILKLLDQHFPRDLLKDFDVFGKHVDSRVVKYI